MRSLRFRLLTAAAVGTLLVLSTSWIALYFLVRDALVTEFDRLLGDKARSLAALVEQDRSEVELEFDEDGGLEEFRRAERPEYFQLWAADTTTLGRSRSLGEGDLERLVGPRGVPAYRSVTLPDGRRGRAAGLSFFPRVDEESPGADRSLPPFLPPQPLTLVVARETAELDRTLASLKIILIAVGSLATAVSLGALAFVVRGGLRPLDQIATQIRNVGEEDLSARIDLANVPPELVSIGERLNDLLTRLEAAFERERAFSANLSHELRTPLAGIKSTLEVGLAGQPDQNAYANAMADCLAICDQMQGMIENFLSLSRIEAGQTELQCEPLRLDELLYECWKPLELRARSRRLSVEYDVEGPLPLHSDRDKLRLVLDNVLENAVSHADTGGSLHIRAESRDTHVELRVTNSGSLLSQQDTEHAFERFWRGDTARRATGIHCGLGLSICRKMVDALGGSISLESEAGGDFSVVLMFDRIPDSRAVREEKRG